MELPDNKKAITWFIFSGKKPQLHSKQAQNVWKASVNQGYNMVVSHKEINAQTADQYAMKLIHKYGYTQCTNHSNIYNRIRAIIKSSYAYYLEIYNRQQQSQKRKK